MIETGLKPRDDQDQVREPGQSLMTEDADKNRWPAILAAAFRPAVKAKGLTVRDLTEQIRSLGIKACTSTIDSVLHGRNRVSFEVAAGLGVVLDVSLDELARGQFGHEAGGGVRSNDEQMLLRIYRHQVVKNGLTLEDAISALTQK